MKVNSIGASEHISSVTPKLEQVAQTTQPGLGERFQGLLDRVGGSGTNELHNQMIRFENRMSSGAEMKPKELLFFQVQAMRLGMRVELVGKVAESASSTAKRLEQRG